MKHVFFVHSAITEKIALSIIKKKEIRDYLFLDKRRFESSVEERKNVEKLYNLEDNLKKALSNWINIYKGDKEIESIVGGKFKIYTPHTSFTRARILMSHPMCEGFSVFEEGLVSYCHEEYMDIHIPKREESVREKIKYRGRLGNQRRCREGYDEIFSVHEKAFPEKREKNILDVKFGEVDCRVDMENRSCILILESLSHYHKSMCSVYSSSIMDVLRTINEKYDKVYYKLHPDSYGNWQEQLLKNIIRRYGPESEEIERSACIEDIAIKAGNDVILNISSTGLYCGLYSEGTVYSFHDIFSANGSDVGSDRKRRRMTNVSGWVPDIFWEHVELLGDA